MTSLTACRLSAVSAAGRRLETRRGARHRLSGRNRIPSGLHHPRRIRQACKKLREKRLRAVSSENSSGPFWTRWFPNRLYERSGPIALRRAALAEDKHGSLAKSAFFTLRIRMRETITSLTLACQPSQTDSKRFAPRWQIDPVNPCKLVTIEPGICRSASGCRVLRRGDGR